MYVLSGSKHSTVNSSLHFDKWWLSLAIESGIQVLKGQSRPMTIAYIV